MAIALLKRPIPCLQIPCLTASEIRSTNPNKFSNELQLIKIAIGRAMFHFFIGKTSVEEMPSDQIARGKVAIFPYCRRDPQGSLGNGSQPNRPMQGHPFRTLFMKGNMFLLEIFLEGKISRKQPGIFSAKIFSKRKIAVPSLQVVLRDVHLPYQFCNRAKIYQITTVDIQYTRITQESLQIQANCPKWMCWR